MSSVFDRARGYTVLMGAAVLERVEELLLFAEFEDEKTCESVHHPGHEFSHADGQLFYVKFITCKCAAMGVTIRCKPWIDTVGGSEQWVCATCGVMENKSAEWFKIIGPVENGK